MRTFVVEADGTVYAVIRMRPAKRTGATKTLPLVLGGGGTLLDPVRALKHLFEVDPVPEELQATPPLAARSAAAHSRDLFCCVNRVEVIPS